MHMRVLAQSIACNLATVIFVDVIRGKLVLEKTVVGLAHISFLIVRLWVEKKYDGCFAEKFVRDSR